MPQGSSDPNFGSEHRPRRMGSHKQTGGQAHEIRDSVVLVNGGYGVTTNNGSTMNGGESFSQPNASNHSGSYSSQ